MRPLACVLLVLVVSTVGACRTRDDLPKDITLPASSLADSATESGVKVVLSRSMLVAAGMPIALVPDAASFRARGFDAQFKKDGRAESLLLAPLVEVLDASRAGAAGWGDATLYVDGTTPYRPFTEVLYTLGHGGITTTHIAVVTGAARATIDVSAPTSAEIAAANPTVVGGFAPLNVAEQVGAVVDAGAWLPLGPLAAPPVPPIASVVVAEDGTRVTSPAGGCVAAKSDVATLSRCIDRARADRALAGTTVFFFAAARATTMQQVIDVVDVASRAFPRVAFGYARD